MDARLYIRTVTSCHAGVELEMQVTAGQAGVELDMQVTAGQLMAGVFAGGGPVSNFVFDLL